MKEVNQFDRLTKDITLEQGVVFPCSVRVGDLSFRKLVAGKLEQINEGQITGESVEEILFFGYAARLCPNEFVAESLRKFQFYSRLASHSLRLACRVHFDAGSDGWGALDQLENQ